MNAMISVAVMIAWASVPVLAEGPGRAGLPVYVVPGNGGVVKPILPDGIGVVNKGGAIVPGLPVPKVELRALPVRPGAGEPGKAMPIPMDPRGKVELIPLDVRVRMLLIGR